MNLTTQRGQPLLLITVDLGSSLTKIIYRVDTTPEHSHLLLMEPAVSEVSRKSIDFYEASKMISVHPENEAWVELGDQFYVVGFLAQELVQATVAMGEVKYEGAIPKILAALGVIALKEGFPEKFKVALAVPLPFKEWEARDAFKSILVDALACFSFCGKPFCIAVDKFICAPEGYGHILIRGKRIGAAAHHMKIASVMAGQRDLSVVISDRGVISGVTEPYGMNLLLDKVINRTSGQDRLALLKAIVQAGAQIKPKHFKPLLRTKGAGFQNLELAQILDAVQVSKAEYWERVQRFLLNHIPQDINEIIFGGGTAAYLKPELLAWAAKQTPLAHLSWSAELEEDVRVIFDLAEQEALPARLSDAYGLSRYLKDQVQPSVEPVVADTRRQ